MGYFRPQSWQISQVSLNSFNNRLFRARMPGTVKYPKDLGLPYDLLLLSGQNRYNK